MAAVLVDLKFDAPWNGNPPYGTVSCPSSSAKFLHLTQNKESSMVDVFTVDRVYKQTYT